ncbi:hypothetical protein Q8F57_014975 [Paraburkholderia terrae]|uniref:hypothetical protein n=1 Tax=Paraburkholderia terrae TaxID=311230 RepID=UPI00296B02B6|nr:hypothetical protein [Paraburkholderia terrae]MDW3659380.1 hypothetical protein [Paraburkholderia terrae]
MNVFMTVLHLEDQSGLLQEALKRIPASFNERCAFVDIRRTGCLASATLPVDRPVAYAMQRKIANACVQRDIARV